MTKNIILSGFLVLLSSKGFSQKLEQISVAATTEAIGLPFTNYFPYHPGLEIKGNIKKTEKPKSIRYFNINLGSFYHQKVEMAFYLGVEYQYTLKLFKGKIGLDFPVGLGYLHSFYPGKLYEQSDDGNFEEVSQLGRPHAYANLGVGLSYLSCSKFQPFIRQELLVETPFANGIPIVPHSILKVGTHINLNINE